MKAGLLRSSNKPSFSSSIYAVVTRALSVPLTYDLFEVAPEEFDGFMTKFPKIVGVNVTIPYKEKVIKYCINDARANPRCNIKSKKLFVTPIALQNGREGGQGKHVKKNMHKAPVRKHIGKKLVRSKIR